MSRRTHSGMTAGNRGVGGPDELLTVAEVLDELRVSRATWYRWRQTHHAPRAIRLPNGELRIRRSALAEWLREREETDREEPR